MEPLLGPNPAADIQPDANIEIINPGQVICTLDTERRFFAEIEVKVGRGYVPGEENKTEDDPIGVIPIDCLYSPVRLVKYSVENTRVGQMTDYDKLILEISTDGRITPDDAVKHAASILQPVLARSFTVGRWHKALGLTAQTLSSHLQQE